MNNNKVSEKAVWDNYIPSDNDNFTPSASQMHTQPQMMFCYKCNNVIPGDSVYCPYCQVKLFTECPKCGAKYSSQYPSCSQCGTNREDYLRIQRREQQRLESIERENRRQKEIAERQRLEEERRRKEAEEERERQKRLQAYKQKENEQKQKEEYYRVNAEITRTQEYESTYALVNEALKVYDAKCKKYTNIFFFFMSLPFIFLFSSFFFNDSVNEDLEVFFTIVGILVAMMIASGIVAIIIPLSRDYQIKILTEYVSDKKGYNQDMVKQVIEMIHYQGKERLPDCCIIAYRKKYQLPYNYSWHSLRWL